MAFSEYMNFNYNNYTVLCTLLFSWRSFRKTSASSSPSTFFLQYGDKRFQVTSNPENGIFLPSPFTEHLSHKLSLRQNSSVDERPFFSRAAGSSSLPTLHIGVFCQDFIRRQVFVLKHNLWPRCRIELYSGTCIYHNLHYTYVSAFLLVHKIQHQYS